MTTREMVAGQHWNNERLDTKTSKLYLILNCIWSQTVFDPKLYLIPNCIWSKIVFDPKLHLPATFYSFPNGCKLINIQHQSWRMAYQKYQNVSHKNRCHLIFHSSPFGIGFGLRFSQNWTPTALLIHGICSRNLSIILTKKEKNFSPHAIWKSP